MRYLDGKIWYHSDTESELRNLTGQRIALISRGLSGTLGGLNWQYEIFDAEGKAVRHDWNASRATLLLMCDSSIMELDSETSFNTVNDPVNHPAHYLHKSGIECIRVTQHENFCVGNALKYLWRSDKKGNQIQDLEKAIWYIKKEIERLKANG